MNKNILPDFDETDSQREFRQEYMTSINKAYKYDESIGIMDMGEDKKISLQDIYVPLKFSIVDYEDKEECDSNHIRDIVDLFKSNNNVVLSGKPGSGKTTLSRSLINALSSHHLSVMSNEFGRRLPLYIKLRDYKINEINNYKEFFDTFVETMKNILKIEITKELLEFYLKKGWCFIIFDGVDEVGSESNRLKVRNYILKHFSKYNKKNYILVTSRPTGVEGSHFFNYTKEERNKLNNLYDKNDEDLKDLVDKEFDYDDEVLNELEINVKKENSKENENLDIGKKQSDIKEIKFPSLYYVAPFDDKQINLYSEKWFKLREENPEVIRDKSKDFISSIEKIKNLSILRRRPVFLSMMIHIHTTKGKLPYSRAMAYRYMVEAYIEHIDIARRLNKHYKKDWSFEDKERVLECLAYKLHSSNIEKKREKESVQITINKDELNETIKVIINENLERWQTVEEGDEQELLEFYISRTGLLHEPEENKIQFSHLSFQEYLTAHYIYKKVIENPFGIENTIKEEIIEKLDDNKWNEVVLLFFSLYKNATHRILEQFYNEYKNNETISKQFFVLILKLLDSIEYGIKDSNVKVWVDRIIEHISKVEIFRDENEDENIGVELTHSLYNNLRIEVSTIKELSTKIFRNLIKEKNYSQCESILYLISFNSEVTNFNKKLIVDNIEKFLDNKMLMIGELFSPDFKEIIEKVESRYTFQSSVKIYDNISYSVKEKFITNPNSWKSYLLKLHWKLINLYSLIELNRVLEKYNVNNTINRYRKFSNTKNKELNEFWKIQWPGSIWHAHRNGFKLVLRKDRLFSRYEYINYKDSRRYDIHPYNKEVEKELDTIFNKLKYDRITKKESFLYYIIMLFFSTEKVSTEYGIDLSIPWKSYAEFREFSKILEDYNSLYNHLKKYSEINISKDDFKKEITGCFDNQFSMIYLKNIILKNEQFYIIRNYKEIKHLISK